jgi:hypothetical protein
MSTCTSPLLVSIVTATVPAGVDAGAAEPEDALIVAALARPVSVTELRLAEVPPVSPAMTGAATVAVLAPAEESNATSSISAGLM